MSLTLTKEKDGNRTVEWITGTFRIRATGPETRMEVDGYRDAFSCLPGEVFRDLREQIRRDNGEETFESRATARMKANSEAKAAAEDIRAKDAARAVVSQYTDALAVLGKTKKEALEELLADS